MKPRLDLVGEYRLNGFGDRLFGQGYPFASSYERLFAAEQTGWDVGIQYSMLLGNRVNRERLRNLHLKMSRALAILEEQQVETERELVVAFREFDRAFVVMSMQHPREEITKSRVDALEAQYRVRGDTADLIAVFNAREALAEAQTASADGAVKYAVALAELHYRMGKMLSVHQIFLADDESGMPMVDIYSTPPNS